VRSTPVNIGRVNSPWAVSGRLARAEPGSRTADGKVQLGCLETPTGRCVPRADRRPTGDVSEVGHPVDLVVQQVPQTSQNAAGGQDPRDLGSRDVHVEPVHGVAGQHSIDAPV
jgi:hypothetical protein